MKQRHGAAEITEVTRQKVDWQRQAARDLAEGRFAEAVAAFDQAGAITWTEKQDDAREALVASVETGHGARPAATRFVFAYTNSDVDALNADLREVRRERGELSGEDVRFETKHGAAAFAIGDRVQFTDTRKSAKIYNGNVGTITGLDARDRAITRADSMRPAGRAGREVDLVGVASSTGSGTATPGRSTKARARPSTTPISTTPSIGGRRRAMSR